MPGGTMNKVNLNDVIAATEGEAVETRFVQRKTVYVNVSVNTTAVTVTIQHSPDGETWFDLDTKTYTAEVTNDDWSYKSHFPYMRTKTTDQTDATVKTWITGRDQIAG